MKLTLTIYWAPPSRCAPGMWLWFTWDIHKCWEQQYQQIRERGFRICGLEVSWDYRQHHNLTIF